MYSQRGVTIATINFERFSSPRSVFRILLSRYQLPTWLSGKESAYNAGGWIQSLVWEDPLEKGMATYSSILAWRIPWTELPGWLQSMGSQRVGHDWVTNTFTFTFHRLRRMGLVINKQLLKEFAHWPISDKENVYVSWVKIMLYIIKIVMHTGEDGATYDAKAVLSVMMRLVSRNEFKEQPVSSVQWPGPWNPAGGCSWKYS